MFFSMTNSSPTFQTMMNNIFWNLTAEEIMILYLYSILIFTWTLEKYYKAIFQILEVLVEHKLFLCPKKCEFDRKHIEYLDLVISENQVEIDPIKVASIQDWPTLTTHTELQAFLGFTNFYQRFIHSSSNISHSLFDITSSMSYTKSIYLEDYYL